MNSQHCTHQFSSDALESVRSQRLNVAVLTEELCVLPQVLRQYEALFFRCCPRRQDSLRYHHEGFLTTSNTQFLEKVLTGSLDLVSLLAFLSLIKKNTDLIFTELKNARLAW